MAMNTSVYRTEEIQVELQVKLFNENRIAKKLKCVSHIGDYSSVALDDVWTVMTLQHNIQIHENPLILIFITRPSHLL